MRTATVLAGLAIASAVTAQHAQTPLVGGSSSARTVRKRPLTGRFLHITDFHPDPHYKTGSTFDSGCHQKPDTKKKDKKGGKGKDKGKKRELSHEAEQGDDEEMGDYGFKGRDTLAGKWGSAVTDCDSPMSLVNYTIDWVSKELANEVDFVVWTGDNARHDIDRNLPRTPKEIFELNRMMVDKMYAAFPSDVPIVPSLGNNDIYPHNVLAAGPNHISEEFLHIWKKFIPEDERHVFERGLYFAAEVIPDQLAVISLNTLYWYDSNTLVDGCLDQSTDPGALEMDWLEVQLEEFRERGMQVWLTGHVPPHTGHYFDNCYLRYGDLALRYQDTIVGHLYGHMNVDHFFFLDVLELDANAKSESRSFRNLTADRSFAGPELRHGPHLLNTGRFRTMGRGANNDLGDTLKKDFGEMPGPQKLKMKDYVVVNVHTSVIPTYFPGLRIYSYNITDVNPEGVIYVETFKRKHGHKHGRKKDDCSKLENQDKPHCTFKHKPRYESKFSPSRSNKPLSPLGYTQFYLPKVDDQTATPPEWIVEYSTFKIRDTVPGWMLNSTQERTQPLPIPLRLLPDYDADLELELDLDTADQKVLEAREAKKERFLRAMRRVTPWKMKDLTIPSYVKLARKLVVEKKMWKKFAKYMYVSSDA